MFENLLNYLPLYKEMDYFLDLVRRHYSFDEKYSGKHSLIILGSSIPEELIYASGAVVTKDVPPLTVVGGIPAKVIKTIE